MVFYPARAVTLLFVFSGRAVLRQERHPSPEATAVDFLPEIVFPLKQQAGLNTTQTRHM